MRHLTLGTAGHVDHGKTTLVRALTGTNTDRLEEERRRGISIVLGYAQLRLGDDLQISVVDVPGHERFVRTMVGGATGIDFALICIAADDGVMPQTREHVAILELLGVANAVVALTKTDLVDPAALTVVTAEIRQVLATTPFANAEIVAVQAPANEGLDELRAALHKAADATSDRPSSGRARLPIDRSFALHGIGTVLTGTLWSGTLSVGDTVLIRPGRAEARVRSLEVHGIAVESAGAGSRVAAALVGVERADAPPGTTLWTGQPAKASYRLDVSISVLAEAQALDRGTLIEVLHGTFVTQGRVVTLEGDQIAPGTPGLAQLRLVRPIAALRGDHVVLRRLAPPGTIAGATVLDPQPLRHAGSNADIERLQLYASGDPAEIVRAALAAGPLRTDDLVDQGLLDLTDVETALKADTGSLTLADWHLAETHYDAIRKTVSERLTLRAREHAADPAVPLGSLLRKSPWRDALIERLVEDGAVERDGANIRLPGTGDDMQASAVADVAVAALAREPFATHRQSDLAEALPLPSDDAWAIIALLDRSGRITRLPDGLVVHHDAYDEAVRIVRARCADSGEVTLAQLRDATSSSRKVAQALLERMDADGITLRTGDTRILRRRSA